ncbi:MAG: PQQ-like beta-propeller repeat protein [Alphaproteobacteria bacterium]|nr:PQQ-like beta-propeller repeat protein [Alphaproteobacteria bacterium]
MSVRIATCVALASCLALAGCGGSKKVHIEGTRISVLELEKTLTPDPKLESTPIDLPAPFANPAWPDSGGYPNHAMYHLALGPEIHRAWKADVGEGAWRYGRVTAEPVATGGRVYAMDANDVVSAYDARNGDRLWHFDPQPKNDDDQMFGGGIAYSDGRIFVATGYAQVIAIDAATGKEIWRQGLASPAHGPPTVADGRVFAITVDNELEVLAASDGRRLWTHNGIPEPAGLLIGASPAVEGDTVIVPYSSGEIYALRVENGRAVWSDNLATARPLGALSSLADIRGQPVIDRDRVFAISHAGILVSIDLRTGNRVWEQDIGGTHMPWVAGDYIYVLANDRDLVCLLRSDGHVRWVRPLPRYGDEKDKTDPLRWSGPVLAGDRLVVISSNGEALSVSPYTGKLLGQVKFSDGVYLDPVVAGRTLYVITDEADLVALR